MRHVRRVFAIAIALLPVLLLAACSEPLAKQKGLTDTGLFARGQKSAAAKDYKGAAEAFQVLLERFPNSPLAAKAQFGLAKARAAHGDDVEAEVAFDEFLRLFPADENIPAALFEKGELLFRQVADPGRDQTKTVEAIKTYTLLLQKAPNDPNAARARERIRSLRIRLARHEDAVIGHYLARKNYESAEARARRAAAEYADTELHPLLLSRLAAALEGEKKAAEAAAVRRTIAEKYPGFGEGKK